MLLERDHAQAVHDRPTGVPVGQVPDGEVREVEAKPDPELEAKISPTARKHLASQSDDPLHACNFRQCGYRRANER